MLDPNPCPPEGAYLQPGEMIVATRPTAVSTVLGSCVAVCLWDRRRAIGGMNHFLLAHGQGEGQQGRRFGNVATPELLRLMLSRGSDAADLVAKIFGGGDVLPGLRAGDDSLGARNVEVARQVLREHRVPVISEDVRGRHGRKLIFHSHDGAAFVRLLGSHR
jgi:chemotaxis protein CheD